MQLFRGEGFRLLTAVNHQRVVVNLRHLFKADEMLALRLAVMHNLYFYNKLTERIRDALDAGEFAAFRAEYSEKLSERA